MRSFLILVLLATVTVPAQTPVRARFDATVVRPTPPERLYQLKLEECDRGGTFVASGTPLEWVIEFAYGGSGDKVTGGPGWLNSFDAAFDVEGKPDHKVSKAECRTMVQSLLEERFGLKVHRETKEVDGYAMTVGKRGPRLQPAKPADAGGGVRVNGALQQSLQEGKAPDGWSMSRLAGFVSDFAKRPVVDETGLQGEYSFSMRFAHTEDSDDPDVATALEEQLGLKLVPTKTPLEMVVIDHVERAPTEN
jgi:uncharacterized protein (TIGR03435 family)